MVIGETRTWWMTVRLAEVCSGQMVRGEGHRHRGILRVDGGEAPPYRWHIKPYPNNVDSFQIKAELRTKSANVPAAIYLAVFVGTFTWSHFFRDRTELGNTALSTSEA